MKKSRIFATVVYFIFTFGIGVLFSLTLPGYFATFTVPAEMISEALLGGDFVTCLVLTEPIAFYRKPVLSGKFEKGGVFLYETVMEVYDRDSAENAGEGSDKLARGMLYKCYTGYIYGDGYDVYAEENNGTCLKITTADGKEGTLPLLDYDANGDGKYDGVSTYTQSGFIVLELRESEVSSIKKLSFTDRTGTEVFTAEAEEALRFQSDFFGCFGDIAEYNELVAAANREGISSAESKEINSARNAYVDTVIERVEKTSDCAITARSAEYQAASEAVGKRANSKAIPFIIIYFVAIYIIADFLLGTHYIIKFFSWFLFKVCKIPRKKKKAPANEDVFGHDYYSSVTLRLDLSEVPEFSGSVEIKYTADGEEFVFTLLKADGYAATVRMKAGVYVNPFIDIDRAYAPVDLPDNLIVEGYQSETIIKIVKREV